MSATLQPFIDYIETFKARISAAKMAVFQKDNPLIFQDYKQIIEDSINEWYDSYSPIYYGRGSSAQDWYEANIAGPGAIDAMFIAGQYTSNQDPAFVFDYAFYQGYHGGSLGGPDFLGQQPNGPSWRVPYPKFYFWGSTAAQTTPIYTLFMVKKDSFMQKWTKILEQDFVAMIMDGGASGLSPRVARNIGLHVSRKR